MNDKSNVRWLAYRYNKGARRRMLNVQTALIAQQFKLKVVDVAPIMKRLDQEILAMPENGRANPMALIEQALTELQGKRRARRHKR